MARPRPPRFERLTLDDLTIDDERSFRHVALYADLKSVVRRESSFRILPRSRTATWDRALFLNLAFWGANEGADVLTASRVPADVVAHVAWHALAAKALSPSRSRRPSAEALFLGESIASAFDVYLVGRLLGPSPRSSFLETQVAAMAQAAQDAGQGGREFARLLRSIAESPERSFASLRELLFDATVALFRCKDGEEALGVLTQFESHPFAPLLHRYELANWILYARAHGSAEPAPEVRKIERALRQADDPLGWLTDAWVTPALTPSRDHFLGRNRRPARLSCRSSRKQRSVAMPSKPKKTGSKKPAVKGKPTAKGGKELSDSDLEVVAGGTRPAPVPARKKPIHF
jgi:hypothetical protein